MSIHDNVFDLIDEMTEPTGPILSWKAQVHIKQFLAHDEHLTSEQYQTIGKQIADKLRRCSLFMEVLGIEMILMDLERVRNQDELNAELAVVYTVCDRQRIFCR